MNRLIIVGNGFDLATGIESSYSSFILWYLKKCISIDNRQDESNLFLFENVNNNFLEKINQSEKLSDFINLIEHYNISLNYNENSGYVSFLKNIIDENHIKNWVDIESLYFKWLILLKESKIHESVKSGLIAKLNHHLKVLELKLCEYLAQEVKKGVKFDDDYDRKVKKILFSEDLLKLNFDEGEFIKSHTLILNFNYTNLTGEYVRKQKNVSQINIHGELNCEDNKIIFGYGDNTHHKYLELEQLNDAEYLKNIKSMSYPLSSNYKSLIHFLETGVSNKIILNTKDLRFDYDFEVLIYGHSCGLSDRILLREIFQHKNCKSIHVAYHENQNDYFNKTIEISRHFDKKNEFLSKLEPFNKKLKIPQLKIINQDY